MKFFIERTSRRPIDYPGAVPYRADEGYQNLYEIDIADIDALMTLIRELGGVVIEPVSWEHYGKPGQPEIEVYDYFRE